MSIDISGAYTGKIFDEKSNSWIKYDSDLRNTETRNIYGIDVPVISQDALISYKEILSRPTDLDDIEAIQ